MTVRNGVSPIPDGYNSVVPHLIVKGASVAIDFYKRAFGAAEVMRMPMPDGGVAHAELKIGNGHVFLCDEFPDMGARSPAAYGGTPVTVLLYVEDVDQTLAAAAAAGAQVKMLAADMFWGDRFAKITDPFGHEWSLATHIEDVSPEECARRAQEAFAAPPGA
jgi:PhnB protein